jgi:hypothetical protein
MDAPPPLLSALAASAAVLMANPPDLLLPGLKIAVSPSRKPYSSQASGGILISAPEPTITHPYVHFAPFTSLGTYEHAFHPLINVEYTSLYYRSKKGQAATSQG